MFGNSIVVFGPEQTSLLNRTRFLQGFLCFLGCRIRDHVDKFPIYFLALEK
jgi:hypothetical protein